MLIPGYACRKDNVKWEATSTTVLVHSAGRLVLIDPGCNPESLESSLKRERLSLDDIDMVTVTHSHYDHSRNTRLFEKNKVVDIALFIRQLKSSKNPVLIPNTEIIVLHTPGHSDKHLSYLVNTAVGKYVIAGDVFWWEKGQEQKLDVNSLIGRQDPVAKNEELLRNSRTILINAADFIIPGHGNEFTYMKISG